MATPNEKEFGIDRTQRCIELMRPEVRELLDLPLEEKVKASKRIIKEAVRKYHRIGVGFSGGADSEVLLHLALQIKQDMPILFVDTCYEFPETIEFMEKLRTSWKLQSLTTVRAGTDIADALIRKYGKGTREFTVAFNNHHKIQPLLMGIRNLGLDAFLAGIRGTEHEERAKESIYSERHDPNHIRVHPLLFWTREDVIQYLRQNKLAYNPLYDKGYTSLGSTLDTTPNTSPSMHERAGRGVERERVMAHLRALGYT